MTRPLASRLLAFGALLIVSLAPGAALAAPHPGVWFEANQGQAPADVAYIARTGARPFALGPDGVRLSLGDAAVALRFAGAAPGLEVNGREPLTGRSHYLRGAERSAWRTSIPHFARVRYREPWPGIDVEFRDGAGQLEFDFLVAPGADPSAIALRFDGAARVELDTEGDLVVHAGGEQLRQRRPLAYQERDGARTVVASRYVRRPGGVIGVAIGYYDTSQSLVIDPVLVYATALGGPALDDRAYDVAVDGDGNAYVTGEITSAIGFPAGGLQPELAGGSDAFVVKLDPNGALVYATYLGGSGDDDGWSIAVDDAGQAVVSGRTFSTDFPTENPLQSANAGGSDAFVAKLDASGGLVYSTYLGGTGDETGERVALTPAGAPVVHGITESVDFPVENAQLPLFRGVRDTFVAQFAPDGQSLAWATYFGGTGAENPDETGVGVAVAPSGDVIICGTTESEDFPVMAALQTEFGGGLRDGFVAKFSPAGAIVFSTYIGSSGGDTLRACTVDEAGAVYATGASRSSDFPLVNPVQSFKSLHYDAVVLKLDPSGQELLFSTFIGGDGQDVGRAIAIDDRHNVYVHGQTNSTDFPKVFPIADQLPGLGSLDEWVAKLAPSGSALLFSSTIGGSSDEISFHFNVGIGIDENHNVVLAGATSSDDALLLNAIDTSIEGFEGYVLRIGPTPTLELSLTGSASAPNVAIRIVNGTPDEVDGQVKLFRRSGGTATAVDLSLPALVTVPSESTLDWATSRPLPGGFSAGQVLTVRLLDRESGQLLAESLCTEVPCP